VLQLSPLKEISSWDYEGSGVLEKQRTVIEPLLWSQWHESRLDHFLNSRVRNMPTISENLQTETNFRAGSALMTTAWQKGWRKGSKSLAKPQGQGSMITKTQGVCLVKVWETPVVLSRNEWTSDDIVMLVSMNVWHRGRLITARSRLVVATRLHTQLSSFRLRILSNTLSCLEES
jgi:hypothetical protein